MYQKRHVTCSVYHVFLPTLHHSLRCVFQLIGRTYIPSTLLPGRAPAEEQDELEQEQEREGFHSVVQERRSGASQPPTDARTAKDARGEAAGRRRGRQAGAGTIRHVMMIRYEVYRRHVRIAWLPLLKPSAQGRGNRGMGQWGQLAPTTLKLPPPPTLDCHCRFIFIFVCFCM